MQPFNRFSMNTSLDRSQILNYTTDFHFFPVRGGRFDDMVTFQISIPEVIFILTLNRKVYESQSCANLQPV